MAAHALLSPSSAIRWMSCPGSIALTKGLPDTTSSYAEEGTAAHAVAANCLENGEQATAWIGETTDNGVTVTEDMARDVQVYIDYVRDVVQATNGQLLVEQRLPIRQITGEDDAHGTADAVILAPDEIIVIDLKFGRGVAVDAEDNPQLQIYALAAIDEFGLVHDFSSVRMVIHQPRLGAVSERVQTVDELKDFAERVGTSADKALAFARITDEGVATPEDWREMLNPTPKGCKFCKAAGTCPALQREVLDQFDAVQPVGQATPADDLAQAMAKADLIETWIKAVRAETEARLMAGQHVPGFKVVQGKKGNRQWSDKTAAEEALKAMRVKHDQMYDYSVISPTTAEKLAKAEVIGPRQWPKLQALITQAEGKPSVVPESDKRPALVLTATADEFTDLSKQDEACDLV